MDIAEVSRRSGLAASKLRYYEEKGLIRSTGRRGLRRVFDATVLDRLSLIALGQVAGFSLDEMARLFAPGAHPRINRPMLEAKARELQRRIAELTALRNGLLHAAACPAPSHFECPKFQRLLRRAARAAAAAKPPRYAD